ncbi:MAG: HAMP domain-containing sensor histidine kinase [Clostridia bacterium]
MKSIFLKMSIRFLLIILISNFIMLALLSFRTDEIVMQSKMKDLQNISAMIQEKVMELSDDLYDPTEHSGAGRQLGDMLSSAARGLEAVIWVVDERGQVLGESHDLDGIFGIGESSSVYVKDADALKKTFGDRREVFTDSSSYVGMLAEEGKDIAFTYVHKFETEVFGSMKYRMKMAVLIHTMDRDMRSFRNSIRQAFLVPMMTAVGLSLILLYFFTKSLTRPIQDFNRIATRVARGDYASRMKFTERKDEIGSLSIAFNAMMDELTNTEVSRQRLLSDVAHELRTPLTSINGFVCGILDGTIPVEEQDQYLGIVKDETERLNKLINNILILSRMDMRNEELEYTVFNINRTIRECVGKMENLTEKNKQTMHLMMEEEDMFVKASEDDIKRVLINIIHNAIKFSREGADIHIQTRRRKGKVLISVRDEGPGMVKEDMDRIWDRFYKGDHSRGMDSSSTGLGLAIVKSIIHKHNETIEVESAPGKGTEFTFTLESVENL